MSTPTFSQWLAQQAGSSSTPAWELPGFSQISAPGGGSPSWQLSGFNQISSPTGKYGGNKAFNPIDFNDNFAAPIGFATTAYYNQQAAQAGQSSGSGITSPNGYASQAANGGDASSGGAGTSGSFNGTINKAALSGLETQGADNTLSFLPLIEQASKQYGVPDYVIAGVIYTESRGNPHAGEEHTGAYGLGQFIPSTAQSMHVDLSTPAGQIDGIARYLKDLHDTQVAAGKSGDDAWIWAKMNYGGFHSLDDYDRNTRLHGYDQIKLDTANIEAFKQALSGYSANGGSGSSAGVPNNIQNIINQAGTQVGKTPYAWGGETPNVGFDCSGLVQYYYNHNGYNLPRTAQQQYNATQRIDYSQAKPGDLLFFAGTDPNDPDYIDHVAIYLGNGKMLSASNPNAGIQIVNVNNGYWNKYLAGVGNMYG